MTGRTHVALLRGINVGGRNTVAMADLRAAVEAAGGTEVATYIQSGNVVFAADPEDADAMADAIEAEVAGRSGVVAPVVVVPFEQLDRVVAEQPFAGAEANLVHVVFRRQPLGTDEVAATEAAAQRSGAKGSADRLAFAAGCVVIHTPGGFGRSVLAAELAKVRTAEPGTARNLRTVEALRALRTP